MKKIVASKVPTGYNSLVMSWDSLAVRTESGTLLVGLTMKQAQMDYEHWQWQERTGFHMDNVSRKGNAIVIGYAGPSKADRRLPWTNILAACGYDAAGEVDAKFWTMLEKDLKDWEDSRPKGGFGTVPTIDPEFEKAAPKILHGVFKARKSNEIEIGALAAYYQITSETDMELDEIKENIRALAKKNPDNWSVGAGGAPKVRRLKDATGKDTDVDAFDTTRKKRSGATPKGLLRLSDATKAAFEKAGLEADEETFDNWMAYCQQWKKTDPTPADLKAFAESVE